MDRMKTGMHFNGDRTLAISAKHRSYYLGYLQHMFTPTHTALMETSRT